MSELTYKADEQVTTAGLALLVATIYLIVAVADGGVRRSSDGFPEKGECETREVHKVVSAADVWVPVGATQCSSASRFQHRRRG